MNKFLLKRPLITEKSTQLSRDGKYVFLVDSSVSATEAKKIVKQIYNVDVKKINVINVKSKKRSAGRYPGVKSGYKKIIMTLKKGQKLDVIPQ